MAAKKTTAKTTTAKVAEDAKKNFDAFAEFFKTPNFDVTAVYEFQRKNIEASVEAGRLVFEGVKTVATQQAEIAKDAFAEANEFAGEIMNEKTPEATFKKGFEAAQVVAKKNVQTVRDAADTYVDAGQKAVAVLQERYTAGVEELNAAAK